MNNNTLIKLIFLFLLSLSTLDANNHSDKPQECTVMIAGKGTTTDGSILFVKTEDDGIWDIDYLWYIPRKTFKPKSVVKLQAGGTIPQVRETYAYFWDECPGTFYSNGIVNEWGVAFGSNGCASKEDAVEEVEARGDLVNGGLGFKLRMILAERSKTAREAILLAAELIDTYGYNASGRNLNIVGPNEAWQLQMVRGKQYVARKVQDDEVTIIANTFSIRLVDMNDEENFICSPNLIDYAIKRGWYDPSSGKKFDFATAYAPEKNHKNHRNTHRQWDMARLLNKSFPITWEQAQTGVMPVSVKPDRRLSLKDAMAIFRNHYEGTDLDKSENYEKSPHDSPFTTICRNATHRSTIIQQRSWLPLEIGTVIWRILDKPCSSVFIPLYLAATKIPDVYHKAPENLQFTSKNLMDFHFNMPKRVWSLDMESASGIFNLLGILVDTDYKNRIETVKKVWQEFEEREFQSQSQVEERAFNLYKKDKSKALDFLNNYSDSLGLRSINLAKDLINDFPHTPASFIKLGRLYLNAEDTIQAYESFNSALELSPHDTTAKKYQEWIRDIIGAEQKTVNIPSEILNKYVGDYGPRHIILREGNLYYQRDGKKEFRLHAISENTFLLEGYNNFRIHFIKDKNGKVTKISGLYIDGSKDESLRDK